MRNVVLMLVVSVTLAVVIESLSQWEAEQRAAMFLYDIHRIKVECSL